MRICGLVFWFLRLLGVLGALGGSMSRNQPPRAPRTPRGRFSISQHRKIKKFKMILKNEKELQGQQLANLILKIFHKKEDFGRVARKILKGRQPSRLRWAVGDWQVFFFILQ
jgi:hypothetical protein